MIIKDILHNYIIFIHLNAKKKSHYVGKNILFQLYIMVLFMELPLIYGIKIFVLQHSISVIKSIIIENDGNLKKKVKHPKNLGVGV